VSHDYEENDAGERNMDNYCLRCSIVGNNTNNDNDGAPKSLFVLMPMMPHRGQSTLVSQTNYVTYYCQRCFFD
jgi:hypothetical protein